MDNTTTPVRHRYHWGFDHKLCPVHRGGYVSRLCPWCTIIELRGAVSAGGQVDSASISWAALQLHLKALSSVGFWSWNEDEWLYY